VADELLKVIPDADGETPSTHRAVLVSRRGGHAVVDVVGGMSGGGERVLAYRDRTEAVRTQTALGEAQDQFRTLTVASPVGMFLDDLHGKATYLHDKCAELVGVPAEEALDLDWVPYIHPDARSRVTTEWARAVGEGTAFRAECRWVHEDGEIVWTLGEVVPVEGRHGEDALYIGTLTDITDCQRAEEDADKWQAQLAQAQKMESVGRLAGGGAHDFANMLNVILGNAELAQTQVDPSGPVYRELRSIIEAAEGSAEVARQLLAFARKQTVVPKVLDLNSAVEGVLKMLRRLIGEDIDLTWRPGADQWSVKIDPSQLDPILANLCVNARDAIAGVGKITVETGRAVFDAPYCEEHRGFHPGAFTMLTVSDDGCGMDGETLDRSSSRFSPPKGRGGGPASTWHRSTAPSSKTAGSSTCTANRGEAPP
jgi:two-component system sensor histidine kinase EvgS